MNDAVCSGLLECLATLCAQATDINACAQASCPGCVTSDAVTKYNAIGSCLDLKCPTQCV
jgi:hypothetical protein